MRFFIYLLLAFGNILISQSIATPKVLVSIKPIYSLVVGVMEGVKTPVLLMNGAKSPHTHPVTPKELRKIHESQLFIWIGTPYETSLRRVVENIKKPRQVMTLIDQPNIKKYPLREGGLWGNHDHNHDDESDESQEEGCHCHEDFSLDGHIWLDPENAKVIVTSVAIQLAELDPKHKTTYLKNAEKLLKRLDDLDQELDDLLVSVRYKPYVVYHDGTQYFDRHFHTNAMGALTGDTHYGFNAQHFLEICDYIQTQKIPCVFTEPQFASDKISDLVRKTKTRVEMLDYLGVNLKADKDAYFVMMRRLANAFLKGLSDN